jgi:hypothetical protein
MKVARRAKRSTMAEATSPAAPAAKVYDETIMPNWAGVIAKVRINCGPSGMTIMKSTITVNCTAARIQRTIRSRTRCAAKSSVFPISMGPPFSACRFL